MGDTARLYEVEIERNVEARMRDECDITSGHLSP